MTVAIPVVNPSGSTALGARTGDLNRAADLKGRFSRLFSRHMRHGTTSELPNYRKVARAVFQIP